MKDQALLNQEQAFGSDQILKVTALLYFKEALIAQEYEVCQELITTARQFGASQGEISTVITAYLKKER